MIEPLAAAAVAAGVDGIFIETHEEPNKAKCDGDIAYPLNEIEGLMRRLLAVNKVRNADVDNSTFSQGQHTVPRQGHAQDHRQADDTKSVGTRLRPA